MFLQIWQGEKYAVFRIPLTIEISLWLERKITFFCLYQGLIFFYVQGEKAGLIDTAEGYVFFVLRGFHGSLVITLLQKKPLFLLKKKPMFTISLFTVNLIHNRKIK